MFEMPLTTIDWPLPSAPEFRDNIWGARQIVCIEKRSSEDDEQVIPDTEVALTIASMAAAFDQLGSPTSQQEVEITVDPDEYPLF